MDMPATQPLVRTPRPARRPAVAHPELQIPATPRWKRADASPLDDSLQRFTLAWMKSLPDSVKPLRCARQHPRVLNRIAMLWSLPDDCLDCLDGLLTDHRGNRAGFSPPVAIELRRLRAHRTALRAQAAHVEEPADFVTTVPMPFER